MAEVMAASSPGPDSILARCHTVYPALSPGGGHGAAIPTRGGFCYLIIAGSEARPARYPQERRCMDSVSPISRGLFIVLALVVVNAFFVAAEYALVRVRRTRMETLAAQGSSMARVVLYGLDHLNRYIAGVQVGITLAGLASGRFGEPALAAILDPLLTWILPPALIGPDVSAAITTGLTLLLISYLLVVLSELVPKAIALQCTDQVALLVAKPMRLAVTVFTPFVWSMNALGAGILRLLRLPHARPT